MRYTTEKRKALIAEMVKHLKKEGPVRLSFILGFKNTSRVENWKQRKTIPVGMEPLVEQALNAKITVKMTTEKETVL